MSYYSQIHVLFMLVLPQHFYFALVFIVDIMKVLLVCKCFLSTKIAF